MKVGEHSRVTAKYLDPEKYLTDLFPVSRECRECHTMIELETLNDVYHEVFHHESSPIRRDWLEWTCPVCSERNQFTREEVLVNAHRRLVLSKNDMTERIALALLMIVTFFFVVLLSFSW